MSAAPETEPTDDALTHKGSARGSPIHYILVVFGGLFMLAPLAISPAVDCVEYPCPLWLRGFTFVLGLLFGGGALVAILRGIEWGSKVAAAEGEILWWHGNLGGAVKRIPIERIGRIVVADGDSVSLSLFDIDGRRILLPSECVRPPIAAWAVEIGRRYPRITVEISE